MACLRPSQYLDVAKSWFRKSLRIILGSVLTEPKTDLAVQPPFAGSFLKRGLSQEDINARIIKLSVRCRGVVTALDEAIQPKTVPEPLVVFFKRLIAPAQSFPGKKDDETDYFLKVAAPPPNTCPLDLPSIRTLVCCPKSVFSPHMHLSPRPTIRQRTRGARCPPPRL